MEVNPSYVNAVGAWKPSEGGEAPLCTSAVVTAVATKVEATIKQGNLLHARFEGIVGRKLTNVEVHYLVSEKFQDKKMSRSTPERLSQTTEFERLVLSRVMKKITAPEEEAKVATLLYGIWEVESCLDKVAKQEAEKYNKGQEEIKKLQASLSIQDELSEIDKQYQQAQELFNAEANPDSTATMLFHQITRIKLEADKSRLAKK